MVSSRRIKYSILLNRAVKNKGIRSIVFYWVTGVMLATSGLLYTTVVDIIKLGYIYI